MTVCGTGGWTGPLPGDPSTNISLAAGSTFGGVDVSWTYPSTNPGAVAHIELYRGTGSNFNTAVPLAVVGGSFYYDKNTALTPTTYYYWARVVSINGTVGEWIGPASATANPTVAQMVDMLNGQIDSSALATALRTELDNIPLLGAGIAQETLDRLADSAALGSALNTVQSDTNQALTLIETEAIERIGNHTALASVVDTLAAGVGTNAAAIITEQTVRASAVDALASQIDTLIASNNTAGNHTYLQATAPSTGMGDGDVWYDSDDNKRLYRYNGTAWVDVSDDRIGANVAAIVAENTARADADTAITTSLTTALSAISSNTAAISTEATTRATADTALAVSITSAQTTLNGNIAAAETRLDTSIATVDGKVTGIGARYTAKLSVNGLIGGFGVYNTGTEIDAGFDVNNFWIGKDNTYKRKPFIVAGNETFIDEAVINKLTFTKLRDEAGAVMIEDGKIKAGYVSTKGLSVTNAAGDVILSSGSALQSQIAPYTSGATVNQTDAVTNAAISAAQTQANTATTNAATAQTAANTANTALANIASDSILSPSEKPSVVQDYTVITGEQAGLDAQATEYGITTEKTAYDSAITTLTSYLGTLTGWNTVPGGDVAIVGTTFRTNFSNVYTSRQALLNAIVAKAKTLADTAQTQANTAVTNAATAQTTANTAVTNAATAQTAANTANTALANIASDSILSPGEKPSVKLDYDTLIAEQAGIDAQATAFAITTEKTAYDTAVSALTTYLGTLTGWNTIPGSDVAIVGTTFRTKFQDVYTARQALLTKIAQVAGTKAAWSGVSGAGRPADNATVGATIGTNLSGQITYGNASTFIADAAIQDAQIGTLNASKIVAGTITTDKLVANAATVASVVTANSTTVSSATPVTSLTLPTTNITTFASTGSRLKLLGHLHVSVVLPTPTSVYQVDLTPRVSMDIGTGSEATLFEKLIRVRVCSIILPIAGYNVSFTIPIISSNTPSAGNHTFEYNCLCEFRDSNGNAVTNSAPYANVTSRFILEENKV